MMRPTLTTNLRRVTGKTESLPRPTRGPAGALAVHGHGEVAPHCAAITPVPGGVGPMTIAMLMKNTLQAARQLQAEG